MDGPPDPVDLQPWSDLFDSSAAIRARPSGSTATGFQRRAEVAFEGGARFHGLVLTGGTWSVGQRCREDRYRGALRALAPDAWEVVWRVRARTRP